MRILGIETSCDETTAAVVEDGHKLLSNVIASSLDLHIPFGGVVPEIAARSHIESILPVINEALQNAFEPEATSRKPRAGKSKRQSSPLEARDSRLSDPWDQIDAIAVTYGPGLAGSLLIGVMTAKTLAIAKNKPLYAINHVASHPYAAFITEVTGDRLQVTVEPPEMPMLALIVSGGHTQLVLFKSHKSYKLLGQTTDDAVGEAFDKVAKILGLPYPGGPSIAQAATIGDSQKYQLPKAKTDNKYDFSFSGLKTAVLRLAQEQTGHDYTFPSSGLPAALSKAQKADIAASFQRVAVETLVNKLKMAVDEFQPRSIVIAGGVAANHELRRQINSPNSNIPRNIRIVFPDIKLCTDNAAMVATLAYYQKPKANPHKLMVEPSLTM